LAREWRPRHRSFDLDEAEHYGECITHAASHYERWQEWQALGGTRRAAAGYPDRIASTEYDEWPRGRVVYETPTRHFVIYADRRLQKPDIFDAPKTAFGLESELIARMQERLPLSVNGKDSLISYWDSGRRTCMDRRLGLDILLPFRLIRISEPAARRHWPAENSRFAARSG
jgi:hypothetical protein